MLLGSITFQSYFLSYFIIYYIIISLYYYTILSIYIDKIQKKNFHLLYIAIRNFNFLTPNDKSFPPFFYFSVQSFVLFNFLLFIPRCLLCFSYFLLFVWQIYFYLCSNRKEIFYSPYPCIIPCVKYNGARPANASLAKACLTSCGSDNNTVYTEPIRSPQIGPYFLANSVSDT